MLSLNVMNNGAAPIGIGKWQSVVTQQRAVSVRGIQRNDCAIDVYLFSV